MLFGYDSRSIHFENLFNEFYAPQTSNQRRREIENELESLKRDPQVYQICFNFIKTSQNQGLMTYAINVVESVSRNANASLQSEAYNTISCFLMESYDRLPSIISKKLVNLLCLTCFRQNPDQIQFSLDRIVSISLNDPSILMLRIIFVLLSEVQSYSYPISTALAQSFKDYIKRKACNLYTIAFSSLTQVNSLTIEGRGTRVASLRLNDMGSPNLLGLSFNSSISSLSANTSRSTSPHNPDLSSIISEKIKLSLKILSYLLENFPGGYVFNQNSFNNLLECSRLVFLINLPFGERLSNTEDKIEIADSALIVLTNHLKLPDNIINISLVCSIFSKFITDTLLTIYSDVNVLPKMDQTYCENFCQLLSSFLKYVLVRLQKLDGFYLDTLLSTIFRVMTMPVNRLLTILLNDIMGEIFSNMANFNVSGSHLNPERVSRLLLELIPLYNSLYFWNHNFQNLKELCANDNEFYEELITSYMKFSSSIFSMSPSTFFFSYLSVYDDSFNNTTRMLNETTQTSFNTVLNRSFNLEGIILSFKDVGTSFKLLSEIVSITFIYKEDQFFEFQMCKEVIDRSVNFMNQFTNNGVFVTAAQNLNVFKEWLAMMKEYFSFLIVITNSYRELEVAVNRSMELSIYSKSDSTLMQNWLYETKLSLFQSSISAYFDYSIFRPLLETCNTLFTTIINKFFDESILMCPIFKMLCQYIQTGKANEISVPAEACVLSTFTFNLMCLAATNYELAVNAREILGNTIANYHEKFCVILNFLKTAPFQQLDQFSSELFIRFVNTLTELSKLSIDVTLAQKQFIANYFNNSIIMCYELVTCTILPKDPLICLLQFYRYSLKAFKKQLGVDLIRNFIGSAVVYGNSLPNFSNQTTLDHASYNVELLLILLEITEGGTLDNKLSFEIMKMVVDHIAPSINQNSDQTLVTYVAKILGNILTASFSFLIKLPEGNYIVYAANILTNYLEFSDFETKCFILSTFAELNRVYHLFKKYGAQFEQAKNCLLRDCINCLMNSYFLTIHEDILKSLYAMVNNDVMLFFNNIFNIVVSTYGGLSDNCKILLRNVLTQTPNDSEYYFTKIMTEFFHDCSVFTAS